MSSTHQSDTLELQPLATVTSTTPACPYTIELLYTNGSSSTYLIRENDDFGEYPNIYVKVFVEGNARVPNLLVLSDSGTGLDTKNSSDTACLTTHHQPCQVPDRWNIATFLSQVLNHGHVAPYLVIATHCHYDHICGIQHLLDVKADVTVLTSSHDPGFVTPWSNLQKHSLCESLGLKAPRYDARWVEDAQRITYSNGSARQVKLDTSITVIHTPGHTPDSMSWYDHDSHTLCVGDMFYEKESDETRSGSGGQWRREPPQPVILNEDSNVIQWNASMHRLLDFVRYENRRLGADTSSLPRSHKQDGSGQAVNFTETSVGEDEWSVVTKLPSRRRVALCASHVTIGTDAEFALLNMLAFMLRVQLDQVPRRRVRRKNHNTWLWDDALQLSDDSVKQAHNRSESCQYSVEAPWSIIHKTA